MTRLPTMTPSEMVRALKRAGFVDHHQQGSHQYLWHQGKQVMTTIPRHAGDLQRPLMKAILKQARLTEAEFRRFC